MNLPNRLTILRLVLVPVFVVLLSIETVLTYALAYVVFLVASYTDYLDGRIARERGLISNFGKLMDPLADKVLMAAAFVMLMKVPTLYIPGWTVVAILAREFLVTGARSMAAAAPGGEAIAANVWGKRKTVIQMVYIYIFLFFATVGLALDGVEFAYAEQIQTAVYWSSYAGIVFVAVFTLWTGIQFAQSNWRMLQLGSDL